MAMSEETKKKISEGRKKQLAEKKAEAQAKENASANTFTQDQVDEIVARDLTILEDDIAALCVDEKKVEIHFSGLLFDDVPYATAIKALQKIVEYKLF